jgi:hypothetical protein
MPLLRSKINGRAKTGQRGQTEVEGQGNERLVKFMGENEIMDKLDKLAGIVMEIDNKLKNIELVIERKFTTSELDKRIAISNYIIEHKIVTLSELYHEFRILNSDGYFRQRFYNYLERESEFPESRNFLVIKHPKRTGSLIAYIKKPSLEGYAAQIFDEADIGQRIEPHMIQNRFPVSNEEAIQVIEIIKKYFPRRIRLGFNPSLPVIEKKY